MTAKAGSSAGGFTQRASPPAVPKRRASRPAVVLQETLPGSLNPPEVRKWPPLATLAFIVATCGAFWAAVAFGVGLLI